MAQHRRPTRAPVIEVHNLHKTYRDGTRAVKGVSFHVHEGEIFGLLGPNGAGKTTTMRMLGTLHGVTEGSATVLGLDIQKDAAALRRRIGFAMQEVGMDDLATAKEMLIFHARLHGLSKVTARRRAAELLNLFELEQHAERRVTRFSGGMQRRLDLAVSLIHDPEMLFLDEPSTGLDPTSRADLWKILHRLRDEKGISILMSTHYMEEADVLCDRIAIMSDGRIAAIDTPHALKRSVGQDIIFVDATKNVTATQARKIRAAFPDADIDGDIIEIRVDDGGKSLMPVLREISKSGVGVEATRVRSPTLDDVFLKYTGQRLQEDQEASP